MAFETIRSKVAPRRRTRLLIAGVVASVLLSACSSSSHASPTPSSTPPANVDLGRTLLLARDALRGAGDYQVTVVGHNFVLPQWGGIDDATVSVTTQGTVVYADVERTGDGRYAVVGMNGETFFRRSTCSTVARIPGGGPDVLKPFLLATNGYLEDASDLTPVDSSDKTSIAIRGIFGGFGAGVIEIDSRTHWPRRLSKERDPATGAETVWTVSRGRSTTITLLQRPVGDVPDQGPGGNPC